MKQYKGYYIDKVIFHNEKEIDDFLRQQAIDAFRMAWELFMELRTVENSIYCDEKAQRLVNQFGFTWEQIEELENQIIEEIVKEGK